WSKRGQFTCAWGENASLTNAAKFRLPRQQHPYGSRGISEHGLVVVTFMPLYSDVLHRVIVSQKMTPGSAKSRAPRTSSLQISLARRVRRTFTCSFSK